MCGMGVVNVDVFLHSILTSIPNSQNYTLIYTSAPSSHVKSHHRKAVLLAPDDTVTAKSTSGGLFQHYQFFTPAIYMGFAPP